jgi:preprotein translocase subunit SecG
MSRIVHRAVVIFAVFVLALFLVASVLLLSGCSAPCSGHGGVSYQLGGWWYCHDGTRQYG